MVQIIFFISRTIYIRNFMTIIIQYFQSFIANILTLIVYNSKFIYNLLTIHNMLISFN